MVQCYFQFCAGSVTWKREDNIDIFGANLQSLKVEDVAQNIKIVQKLPCVEFVGHVHVIANCLGT